MLHILEFFEDVKKHLREGRWGKFFWIQRDNEQDQRRQVQWGLLNT